MTHRNDSHHAPAPWGRAKSDPQWLLGPHGILTHARHPNLRLVQVGSTWQSVALERRIPSTEEAP